MKIERQKAKDLKKSRWWQTLIANNPVCYYCSRQLDKKSVTMDHIVPISQGGKSNKGNLVCCCLDCNQAKLGMTAVEWQLFCAKKSK